MRNESGRSMVEMLGVLAIIGVLSVGGIAGYTMAMNKYKANEIMAAASQCMIMARSANAGEGGPEVKKTSGKEPKVKTERKVRKNSDNKKSYPFQMYVNLNNIEQVNFYLFYDDVKFLKLIYKENHDEFNDAKSFFSDDVAEEVKKEVAKNNSKIDELTAKQTELEEKVTEIMMKIPNIIDVLGEKTEYGK